MKKLLFFILLIFFGLSLSIFSAEFRFALMTDLHISSHTPSVQDLESSVMQINKRAQVDFVLVTGDITEYGDKPSLLKAKFILDQLYVPYYIISGNHETTWSESGCTAFSEVFGSEYFEFNYKGYTFLGFPSGPILRMSDSHVSPKALDWLKTRLNLLGKDQPVFLLNHYPIREGDVDNWYDVLDAVHPYHICAFLGGHYHSNRVFSYEGIPGLLNRSNLRGNELAGGYTIYEINGTNEKETISAFEVIIGKKPIKWAEFGLGKHPKIVDWTKRPNYSMNKLYPEVEEIWSFKLSDAAYSSPIVFEDLVYAADDAGVMHCINLKDGEEVWNFKTQARIMGVPAVAENKIVFGSCDHHIYACDAKTGDKLWSIKANAVVMGGASIDEGVVYIGASDGAFRAIDLKKGKTIWTYNKVKGYIQTKPLIYQDKVYFGAWDGTFYALNIRDGSEAWLWHAPKKSKHYSPAACWPVASGNAVFIVDPERAMTAIDADSGKTFWRTKQSKVRESIGISKDKKRIYAKIMNDSVVCYRANSIAPEELWAVNVDFGYEHAPAMLKEKDAVLYGTTKGGVVFAIDINTQKILWKHKVGNALLNTVFPISNTTCLVSGSEGRLVLLQQKKK